MEGFQRWTSPWLFAPLSCLIYLFVCVCVQADSSEGDNSPENYSERPSCFWISSQEFINKHNSGTRPPTALRNISMKRLIAPRSLPPRPRLWALRTRRVFWSFQFIRNECQNELPLHIWFVEEERFVWSVLIYGWLQYTVIQIMRRALILKNTPIHSNWQLKCLIARHKQTQKITATVPN